MSHHAKSVRVEYGLTQEEMARVLGLSKKTLVEIEKMRTSPGRAGAVSLSALFPESQVLAGVFGGKRSDLIHTLVFDELTSANKER